jgi:O-acetylserine/cysteine efflux transporter
VTVWSGLVVPVPALALSLAFEGPAAVGEALGHLQWQALASTAYTAYLSSLVGYGIWNTLLGRYPVAKVTPFAMLVPVFGMAAAAVAFDERPHLLELAGGLVLLVGVAVAVTRRRAHVGAVVSTTPRVAEPAAPPAPTEASALLAVEVEPPAGSTGEATDLVELAPTSPGAR